MADDRWNLKGSDPEAIKAFREIKQEYEARSEGRVTNDDALLMLVEGVDVEAAVDYDQIRQIVQEECGAGSDDVAVSNEDLQTSINSLSDSIDNLVERLR